MPARTLLVIVVLLAGCNAVQEFHGPTVSERPDADVGVPEPPGQTLDVDAGLCTDLANDGANCGACRHSCLGGSCREGRCQPVVLAEHLGDSSGAGGSSADGGPNSGPGAVVVDATHAYWLNGLTSLMRIPLAGGKPARVAELPRVGVGKLVMSDAIYILSGGALFRVTKEGALTRLADYPTGVRDFALTTSEIVFMTGRLSASSTADVFVCPRTGCPAAGPSSVSVSLRTGALVDGIAATDAWLFVSAVSTASQASLSKFDRKTGTLKAMIGQHAQRYAGPTVDGVNVYSSDYRYIVRSAIDPNPDSSVMGDKYIVSGDDVRMAAVPSFDEGFITWAEGWGPRRVVRCAKRGCAEPEPLWVSAAGAVPTDWWGKAGAPDGAVGLGTNDVAIVFTTGDGKLMKLAKPARMTAPPTTP